jgi:hypothetical protein
MKNKFNKVFRMLDIFYRLHLKDIHLSKVQRFLLAHATYRINKINLLYKHLQFNFLFLDFCLLK